MGTVDYWSNAFTPERLALWERAVAGAGIPVKIRTKPDDSFCDPEEMIERMDELGIDTLVLVVADPDAWRGVHDFTSVAAASVGQVDKLAERFPGRFVAQWSYDPQAGSDGVRRARAALSKPWTVGLHLHTHSFDRPFDHADHYPFYSLAAEVGVPVVMQAGSSGGLSPSACGAPIGIDRPALYFPEVNFVLSHTGWPWVEEAISMALKFPNVYLGTAVYPARHWNESLRRFVGGAGRRKVLYGSGFPAAGHRHTLAQLGELELSQEALSNYLGENARRVFGARLSA
ncbi:amidohydrolase family protein [Rhodococcus sp. IEGM1428]|uniref:amidohydrolase family protein n=1 Tax=Rhodococcus sp. IEGM1428 TaxID=3392191 RepID=UPI003D0D1500